MTNDQLEIESFLRILYRIRDNDRDQPFTHKQIRVYLQCINDLWERMELLDTPKAKYYQPEIKFLLAALSCRMSHEKRGFLAVQLIKLLENIEESKPKDYKPQSFDTSNF